MIEHTPGPWSTDDDALYIFAKEEGSKDKFPIAQIRGWGHLSNSYSEDVAIEIQKANAKLIAAAPDLLATLKKITEINLQSTAGAYIQLALVKHLAAEAINKI